MKKIDLEEFNNLLEVSSIKQRLKRELRFNTSTSHLESSDWQGLEMLYVANRSGNEGVLLVEVAARIYLLPCEFKKIGPSISTGRPQPIICDFCKTWQSGTRSGTITFTNVKSTKSSVRYLCCADLRCSDHVRTKTSASKISRAQLREDMDDEDRIKRLNDRLDKLLRDLHVTSAEMSS